MRRAESQRNEIRDLLKAGLTVSKQFTIESKEQPLKIYSMDQLERSAKQEPAYDWWELANGDFAKIYHTVLKGEIFSPEGKERTKDNGERLTVSWNPLSNRFIGPRMFDMIKRKSGDNPKGWPEWTK